MADDQSPAGQQKDGGNAGQKKQNGGQAYQEVSATDLLSLWGGATGSPAKPPVPPTAHVPLTPTPPPVPRPVPPPPPSSASRPVLPPQMVPIPQAPVFSPAPVQPVAHVSPPSAPAASRPTPPPFPPAAPTAPKPPPQERRPEPVDWFKPVSTPPISPVPVSPPVPAPRPTPPPPRPTPPPSPKPPPKPPPKPKPLPEIKKELENKAIEGELIDDIPRPAPKPKPKFEPEEPEQKFEPKPKPKPEPKPESEPAFNVESPPASGIPDISSEVLDEKEGIGGQIDELLQELNLSRKHIFMGLGCVVLVIISIIGGVAGYRHYKNKGSTEILSPPPVTDEDGAPEKNDTGPKVIIADDTTGVDATSDVGSDIADAAGFTGGTGILATVSIGSEVEDAAPLSYYIFTFRRLQNAYETDIDEILNKTTDRRARLQAHLSLMHKLYDDSTAILQDIGAQLESIKNTYEPLKQKQEIADTNFFEQLNALNAQTADDMLKDFIEASRETVMLKARFKALQKVQSFYEVALPKVARLIRDIELNQEALISGIKIYDVRGSDLQLILPADGENGKASTKLSDGAVTPNDGANSPTIPFIPVHPTEVKTGDKDFITQPGGGF